MSDWPAIISATATALGTGGGGVVWLYRRIDARFRKVEGQLERCRKAETAHLVVIELLWQAAAKSKAAAPVLARCKEHLDKLKEGKDND